MCVKMNRLPCPDMADDSPVLECMRECGLLRRPCEAPRNGDDDEVMPVPIFAEGVVEGARTRL